MALLQSEEAVAGGNYDSMLSALRQDDSTPSRRLCKLVAQALPRMTSTTLAPFLNRLG